MIAKNPGPLRAVEMSTRTALKSGKRTIAYMAIGAELHEDFIVTACNAHESLVAALRVVDNCIPDSDGGVTLGSYERAVVRTALGLVQS